MADIDRERLQRVACFADCNFDGGPCMSVGGCLCWGEYERQVKNILQDIEAQGFQITTRIPHKGKVY